MGNQVRKKRQETYEGTKRNTSFYLTLEYEEIEEKDEKEHEASENESEKRKER